MKGKDMDKLKKSLVSAATCSIALVIMLILTASDGRSDIVEVIGFFALLAFTACTIWAWLRYLRGYVDFAIEQKLKEIIKKPKD